MAVKKHAAIPRVVDRAARARSAKPAAPAGASEEDLQRAVIETIGYLVPGPTHEGGAVVFAVPNGGWRSKAEAGILKALGVRAGVFDLAVLTWDGRVGFIELKEPGKYKPVEKGLSGPQEDFQDMLVSMKIPHAVLDNVDHVMDFLRTLGVTVKRSR